MTLSLAAAPAAVPPGERGLAVGLACLREAGLLAADTASMALAARKRTPAALHW